MAKKEKGPLTPKQQKIRKVFSAIANIIGVLVVIVTLFVSVLTITRTKENDGLASVFGYSFMPVLSDSMVPTIMVGDLIIVKQYNGDGSDLKVGDIVTFQIYMNGNQEYNTHRIVEVHEDGYGSYWFITRGDNSPDLNHDGIPDDDYETKSPIDIYAKYTDIHITGLGQAIYKLQTDPTFYFLVVVTPLILLFVIYVFFFVRSIVQMKLQKTREEALAAAAAIAANPVSNAPSKVSLEDLSDEEKLQLLLELQAKKNADKKKDGDNPAVSDSIKNP